MKIIDEAHARGDKVISFTSYCGGLPAPEFSNNPLGCTYKLVSFAYVNALFQIQVQLERQGSAAGRQELCQVPPGRQGRRCPWHRPRAHHALQVVEIPSERLFTSGTKDIRIYPGFAFEGYPNRDSTPYGARYGIPEAQTILRGTLRYRVSQAIVW